MLGVRSILDDRKLIYWVKRICMSTRRKFVDFSPGALDIINIKLAIRLINSFRDDTNWLTFFNIVIAVIKNFSSYPWLLDEGGPGSLNIIDLERAMIAVEKKTSIVGDSLQRHGNIVFVIVLECHREIL